MYGFTVAEKEASKVSAANSGTILLQVVLVTDGDCQKREKIHLPGIKFKVHEWALRLR